MYKVIYNEMSLRYEKATLTKKELAVELNISESTINRNMNKGVGIPGYLKLGDAKNSKVIFPILEVAKFLNATTKVFYS